MLMAVCACVHAQFCPTLCNPMDCNPPGSTVHGDSPGKNTGGVAMPSSRGFFKPRNQTQESGLLNCRQILYHLSRQRSPRLLSIGFILLLKRNQWEEPLYTAMQYTIYNAVVVENGLVIPQKVKELPYDPGIPLLDIYQKNWIQTSIQLFKQVHLWMRHKFRYSSKYTYNACMFWVALFTIGKS